MDAVQAAVVLFVASLVQISVLGEYPLFRSASSACMTRSDSS